MFFPWVQRLNLRFSLVQILNLRSLFCWFQCGMFVGFIVFSVEFMLSLLALMLHSRSFCSLFDIV